MYKSNAQFKMNSKILMSNINNIIIKILITNIILISS